MQPHQRSKLPTSSENTRHSLRVRQGEPQMLGVMADVLRSGQLERDPTLIAACQNLGPLLDRWLLRVKVIAAAARGNCQGSVQRGLRRRCGSFRRIGPHVLSDLSVCCASLSSCNGRSYLGEGARAAESVAREHFEQRADACDFNSNVNGKMESC